MRMSILAGQHRQLLQITLQSVNFLAVSGPIAIPLGRFCGREMIISRLDEFIDCGVDVRGWVDEPSDAKKDAWAKKYSDHSLLYFEVQKV